LISSGSAFVLSLSLVAARSFMSRRQKKNQSANPPADIAQVVAAIIESLGNEIDNPIRENPKTALMLAGLAGFIAADRRI
jgi:hypothetical protein